MGMKSEMVFLTFTILMSFLIIHTILTLPLAQVSKTTKLTPNRP